MFGMLDVSASGLVAQRTRLEVTTANLANQNTILDSHGRYSPFRRRMAVLKAAVTFSSGGAAQASTPGEIRLDQSPFHQKYEPNSPYADAKGNVSYPNVDESLEMVDAMDASRAYEANITAAESIKAMFQSSLRLLA